MNIRTKILASPFITIVAMLLLGAVTFFGIRSLQEDLDLLANVKMQRLIKINQASEELLNANGDLFRMFTWMSAGVDEQKVAKQTAAIDTRIDSALKQFQAMAADTGSEEEKRELKRSLLGWLNTARRSTLPLKRRWTTFQRVPAWQPRREESSMPSRSKLIRW